MGTISSVWTYHAFIEFSEKCSVGYALALMEGTTLYGQLLVLSPKIESEETYKYVKAMATFNYAMQCNPNYFYQYLPKDQRYESTSTPQYHQQRNYSNDTRNYRDSNNIKYSSYSDLNRSSPSYSNYLDNRQQRDNYDHCNRRHSYTNSQQNRYSHYPQQQQQHNRSFSNNFR